MPAFVASSGGFDAQVEHDRFARQLRAGLKSSRVEHAVKLGLRRLDELRRIGWVLLDVVPTEHVGDGATLHDRRESELTGGLERLGGDQRVGLGVDQRGVTLLLIETDFDVLVRARGNAGVDDRT